MQGSWTGSFLHQENNNHHSIRPWHGPLNCDTVGPRGLHQWLQRSNTHIQTTTCHLLLTSEMVTGAGTAAAPIMPRFMRVNTASISSALSPIFNSDNVIRFDTWLRLRHLSHVRVETFPPSSLIGCQIRVGGCDSASAASPRWCTDEWAHPDTWAWHDHNGHTVGTGGAVLWHTERVHMADGSRCPLMAAAAEESWLMSVCKERASKREGNLTIRYWIIDSFCLLYSDRLLRVCICVRLCVSQGLLLFCNCPTMPESAEGAEGFAKFTRFLFFFFFSCTWSIERWKDNAETEVESAEREGWKDKCSQVVAKWLGTNTEKPQKWTSLLLLLLPSSFCFQPALDFLLRPIKAHLISKSFPCECVCVSVATRAQRDFIRVLALNMLFMTACCSGHPWASLSVIKIGWKKIRRDIKARSLLTDEWKEASGNISKETCRDLIFIAFPGSCPLSLPKGADESTSVHRSLLSSAGQHNQHDTLLRTMQEQKRAASVQPKSWQ